MHDSCSNETLVLHGSMIDLFNTYGAISSWRSTYIQTILASAVNSGSGNDAVVEAEEISDMHMHGSKEHFLWKEGEDCAFPEWVLNLSFD